MKTKLLLVDDEQIILSSLSLVLSNHYEVRTALSVEAAQSILEESTFDVVVTDLNFHGQKKDGTNLVEWINEKMPTLPVIILSGEQDVRRVLSAQRRILDDFLVKPVELPELIVSIEKAKQRASSLSKRPARKLHEVITQDVRILESLSAIKRFMEVDSNLCLCIYGESGTGKEELAKFAASARGGPFITVNMGAIPSTLQESELFGHVKGSFTGASMDRVGKFQSAQDGVLFLDEIGDCSLDLQVKLLRALQEREVVRVGSNRPEKINAKIIVATNHNLRQLVSQNKFREELLWRIEGIVVNLPPLRERTDDIPFLVAKFINDLSPKARPATISKAAVNALKEYNWPGNVRQLRTVIEKALIDSNMREIDVDHLPPEIFGQIQKQVLPPQYVVPDDEALNLSKLLRSTEELAFRKALRTAGGSREKAMQLLGVTRPTFYRRLSEFGLLLGVTEND